MGFQAVHSNFAGNQVLETGPLPDFDAADRNQVFFTPGFFRRPSGGGWQTGMVFALFYQRRFTGGGRGRVWAGVSGNGDAIFGLDGTVPIGTSWALENNFTCLFPKQGPRSGGQAEESWSVSIQLVWCPGRAARRLFSNRYHPLLYVADNSWFLVDRRR